MLRNDYELSKNTKLFESRNSRGSSFTSHTRPEVHLIPVYEAEYKIERRAKWGTQIKNYTWTTQIL